MCLISKDAKALVSYSRIPVYKVIDGDGYPPFFGKRFLTKNIYQYHYGTNYAGGRKQIISTEMAGGGYMIEDGFLHAFTNYCDATDLASERNTLSENDPGYFRVVKMYVPIGAEYYVSEIDHEICSTSLVWDKNDQR